MGRWTYLFGKDEAERYRRLLREIQEADRITRHFLKTGEIKERSDMAGEPGIHHYVHPQSNLDDGQGEWMERSMRECQTPPEGHTHVWEEQDFGRYYHCDGCGMTRPHQVGYRLGGCQIGAELHHRSCALRLGGKTCTC